jgi:hypothetical protein
VQIIGAFLEGDELRDSEALQWDGRIALDLITSARADGEWHLDSATEECVIGSLVMIGGFIGGIGAAATGNILGAFAAGLAVAGGALKAGLNCPGEAARAGRGIKKYLDDRDRARDCCRGG